MPRDTTLDAASTRIADGAARPGSRRIWPLFADGAEIAAVAPARVFGGDRPSNTIAFKELNGYSLGRLIARCEDKVAVQGWLWNIDSFNQWGVELGKVLAGGIIPDLSHGARPGAHDGSTEALIGRIRALRGGV